MTTAPGGGAPARFGELLTLYTERRILTVVALGFSSGLPLALSGATLAIWLTEAGVSLAAIGAFALVGLPYVLKFLWAPFIDGLSVPWLGARLGRRRAWAITTQLVLMAALLALGASDPAIAPFLTALSALLVAFASASQDVVVDALRIEMLEERQQGAGAAMLVLGYRIGMLAAGAGALLLATYVGWFAVYAVMAALVTVGIGAVLATPEPAPRAAPAGAEVPLGPRLAHFARAHIAAPLTQFMERPAWFTILLFVVLYKFGDALAGVMANPFYIQIGFTKLEIAEVAKAFGLVAIVAGGLLGGALVYRTGVMAALVICGVLQMMSNLMFALLSVVGHDLALLALTVGIENLAGGMGTAAFVAYLSNLCHRTHTATQYALLSALAALGRTVLSSGGGWLAEQMSWAAFFVLTTAAALPGLLVLVCLMRGPAARAAVQDG